ncbi:mechanosensitive ion channel family protein [Sphingomonas montanisoli]|uniref:Mechanosensitive ion channel n=1 Tax=Sphingomonas montanisoli TaxID=2606412 RepID=A0A5D9C717_9SPHN|nr:mechanosensitive ion channel domain-containing protein [Sphingomonas montanisoli]TZG25821.1 mechanosensitive ion channel [Sphingomonas montanisoli]
MDWHDWIERTGLPLPESPDVESLVVAIVLIAGAVAIGWFVGHRAGPPLTARIHNLGGRTSAITEKVVTALVQYAVIALLLLIVGNAVVLNPLALMTLAVALGVAMCLLVYRIVKACGLGKTAALLLALAALVATTAGTLGGMRPLIKGLDGVGFSVGAHRFSLLAVVNAIVIIAVLYVVAKTVNHILTHLIGRASGLDISQQVLVQKLAGIGVVVIAVLLGIDLLGIDLTALTVFSGAAGLAIGFGLQKTFGNLIAGLILLMDRSVKPGDVIVVGDTFGAVGKIGVRAVSVVTRDGKEHLIPNEQLMTEAVENWSYSSRNVRIHIPVGVAYGCDLALAQKLMVEAATGATRVLTEPKPSVWLKAFGDSSIDHDILVWIADPELGVGNVRSDILNRVWRLFADNAIEIPFPQRDIHIRSIADQM